MTDKTKIKETGLLEQYVLGELDAAQQLEIELLLKSDEELADYVLEIEKGFENLAIDNAITPPKVVKSNLLSEISNNTKVVSLSNENKSSNKWYLGIAASIAAFLLISTYFLYAELQNVKSDLEMVSNEKDMLMKDLNNMANNYDDLINWYDIISDPNAEQFILKGNDLSPEAKIVSYVNHEEKSVVINAELLPELDQNHDYQMWADVDGEMINMGLIPKSKGMIAMTYIDNAESLNITIEPLGGNDHPTVSRLISNVYL
ncbi:anti-sigma factor [Ichthyenterobacterium sp. W332]|uniref:Anti-sigma factor n=1 Tax=Microcosmobacter mediterraneus TaxID=3075607 RepID=A0ABU2YGH8_9FLAO|nr:anti-sigma factor [Ichthyenterobacterium sp. W332]MDT0557289.1 anti-sigma factor [Ichthyenterobacterium sp. W332]